MNSLYRITLISWAIALINLGMRALLGYPANAFTYLALAALAISALALLMAWVNDEI